MLVLLRVTEVTGALPFVIVNTPLVMPALAAVPVAVVTLVPTSVEEIVKVGKVPCEKLFALVTVVFVIVREGLVPADQPVISSAAIAVPSEAEPTSP